MKKYILSIFALSYFTLTFGQNTEKEQSILQSLVEKIHWALRDVATRSAVPYTSSVYWAKQVYVERGDSVITVPFDSLTPPKWNHLDYDITVEFDRFTSNPGQDLKGVIVLKPIGAARLEKLKKWSLQEIERQKAWKKQ